MFDSNYVDVTPEKLADFLKKSLEHNSDYVLATAVVAPKSVTAPTKKKPNYVVETVNMFSPDCFSEQGAAMRGLMKSGFLVVGLVPKDCVNPALLKSDKEAPNEPNEFV